MPLSRITSPFQSATANVYSPSANTIALRTSSADRVVLNSSGNIGMGSAGTTAAADIHINDTMSSNTAYHTAMILQGQAATGPTGSSSSGGIELQFRGRTDGAIANSTIASIGGYINTNAVNNAGGIFFRGQESAGTGLVPIFRVNQDGLVLLKGSTANGGTGIAFPASQSASSDANTLDDYEEGTFTPTAFGAASAGTTTYNLQQGSYTKIGRQVTITVALQYSSQTGTGELRFGNFPFTINNSEYIGPIMADNLNWSTGTSIVLYGIANRTDSVIFGSSDDGSWAPQQCVNETAGFRFTLTYFTST